MTKQCEGYRRTGGAFSHGPVTWKQCENDAIVVLTVNQDGDVKEYPSCSVCWNECIEFNIEIVSAVPYIT